MKAQASIQYVMLTLQSRKCDCIFVESDNEVINKGGTAGYTPVLCGQAFFVLRQTGKCKRNGRRNHMKKLTSMILSAAVIMSLAGCSASAPETDTGTEEKKVYKVAVIKQLDHASLDEIANAITGELDALSEEKGIEIVYTVDSGNNDPTVLQQFGAQYVSGDVDVIIPIATLAAQTMYTSAEDSGIPVVFAAVSDPESAQLTGLENITGTSDGLDTNMIMNMMFAIDPDIKKVGLLYSQSEINSEKPIELAKAYLDSKGIAYVEATGNNDSEIAQAVTSLIAADVDAVFTPTDNVVMATEITTAEKFAEAGIPHYTGADSFVRNGAFATCGVNYTDLGKQTADLAYQAMTETTSDMDDYYLVAGGIITVNTETAEALNIDYSVFGSMGEVVEVITTEE